jgi:hypothetical protein
MNLIDILDDVIDLEITINNPYKLRQVAHGGTKIKKIEFLLRLSIKPNPLFLPHTHSMNLSSYFLSTIIQIVILFFMLMVPKKFSLL